jgi:hypothetical protein
MTNWLRRFLPVLVLAGALAPQATVHAQVRRCVDAQGKVTFTDQACPSDSAQQRTVPTGTVRGHWATTSSGERRPTFVTSQTAEQLAATYRDRQAQCRQGKLDACHLAACMRVYMEDDAADAIRECAEVRGLKTTAKWAQTTELRGARDLEVSVYCLRNPETITYSGGTGKVWKLLSLRSVDVATARHERGRWYDAVEGPDFATWEEAADALCSD